MLVTLRADGSPHAVPVGVTLDVEAGLARVICRGGSVKARNAAARGVAVVSQVDGRRWSTLEGAAVVRDEAAAVAEAERRYALRYRQPRPNPERVVIEIAVTPGAGSDIDRPVLLGILSIGTARDGSAGPVVAAVGGRQPGEGDMSTALNTDAHDGPPAESVAITGTDGPPSGSVPDLTVKTLGVPKIASPMAPLLESRQTTEHYVDETDRVLLDDTLGGVIGRGLPVDQLPGLEPCGPRRKIFFDPSKTRAAIVTCGGLCPGLNDVIAGLVRNLTYHYKVRRVIGIQNGYQGFIPSYGHDVIELNPETVRDISVDGGTVLGTSRGPQDPEEIVDCLERLNINMLFVIGGDGSMRGAMQIVRVIGERGLRIAVVGIPKTIDNDIPLIDQSFGFQTAFSLASDAIRAARVEAKSTANGVGLVRLMGRHSGFIACYAALARSDADVVLIPEVPFALDGPHGLLEHVRQRVAERGNAVVVVAEGAGQDLLEASEGNDASGNTKLRDIGPFLRSRLTEHFEKEGVETSIRYIDPSYAIRSVPANPYDSVYCVRLSQAAVHAAMSGRTEMVVGRWRRRFVHLPMALAVSRRNQVDPRGDLWMAVLESTGQPVRFTA